MNINISCHATYIGCVGFKFGFKAVGFGFGFKKIKMDSDSCGFGFETGGFRFELPGFAHHGYVEPVIILELTMNNLFV